MPTLLLCTIHCLSILHPSSSFSSMSSSSDRRKVNQASQFVFQLERNSNQCYERYRLIVHPHRTVVAESHKPAVNHISGSRKCRCSFFGHAWIQDLEQFPDGTIVRHSKRVKEEMLCIPAQQTSSTPAISISRKSLRNENIAHFHTSPEIAAAVIAAASFDGGGATAMSK